LAQAHGAARAVSILLFRHFDYSDRLLVRALRFAVVAAGHALSATPLRPFGYGRTGVARVLIAEAAEALNLRKALLERHVIAALPAIVCAVDRAPGVRVGLGRLSKERRSGKHESG
jgi:hypothetical protein